MSTVQIAQLIYTRVEPAYSAQGLSGYQTVYKTPSLAQAAVGAIEQRVQCFRPSQPGATRLQFFALPGGAVAVTHTVLIASDPVIVDKDSRPGVFLVHCLVAGGAQFAQAGNDPFALVDGFRFITSPTEMVESFGKATGVAPELTLVIKPALLPRTRWEAAEARKLVTLAMQAQELPAKGQVVLLLGSQPEIIETLHTAFYLMPRNQRLACAFDTWIEGCPYQGGALWAAGSPTWVDIGASVEVRAGARRVVSQVAGDLDARDLYQAWLLRNTAGGKLDPILGRVPAFQDLAEAFVAQRSPSAAALDVDTCREFLGLHEEAVVRGIDEGIAQWVGKRLAPVLRPRLRQSLSQQALVSCAAARQVDPELLSACAVDWLLADRPDLADAERRAVQGLARSARDERLLFVTAVLSKKPDTEVREEALRRINVGQFRWILDLIPDLAAPAALVTQGRADLADLLMDCPKLDAIGAPQLVDLVSALCAAGFGARLGPLVRFLPDLSGDSLAQIEKRIAKEPAVARGFMEAVAARRQELGAPVNVLGRLKALMPRAGGKQ